MDSRRSSTIGSAEDRLPRGAEVAASTLSAAAASDYRAAAILLKGRGLLDGRPTAAAEPSSVQAFLQAVPPGKRRVFELRCASWGFHCARIPKGRESSRRGSQWITWMLRGRTRGVMIEVDD